MSNLPRRTKTESDQRSSPMLFVIVLLVIIAGVLTFVALHSSGPNPSTPPTKQTGPADLPKR